MNVNENNSISISKFPLNNIREVSINSYSFKIEAMDGNGYYGINLQDDSYKDFDQSSLLSTLIQATANYVKTGDFQCYSYNRPKSVEDAMEKLAEAVLEKMNARGLEDVEPF
jgi:hypothetical protein